MKIISKKIVKLVVWVLIAVTLLCGCNPQRYSESEEEALIQACLPAIHEFLAEHCGEYELGEFHLAEGQLEENTWFGRYGSNVVSGSYTAAGNTWDLVYDRETGEFYTDELLEKLRNQEQARILEYLKDELPEEDLRDFELTSLYIQYTVQSHDIKIDRSTTADTYVCVSGKLPAGITEAGLPEFAARGFDGGTVGSISCHYYSDRANALTQKAFEQFLTDNPAYQVDGYRVFIYNDNPSAKEENAESAEETWFRPEPAGKDADCRIEYENGMILAKRPHFTESGGIVTMQFNAIDWYCVRVIHIEDAEKYFPDEKMLAQSSNLKVFQSYENQKFEYSCVFVPYDGSNYVFLFETDTSPEAEDFGSNFDDCIHYYAGGEEVFPDRAVLIDGSGLDASNKKAERMASIDFDHLVTDAFRETIADGYDASMKPREWSVPQIMLDDPEISELNKEIWKTLYESEIQNALDSSAGHSYQWAVNGDILSLWIESHPEPWDWTEYYVYNVSISKGEQLRDGDVYSAVGLSGNRYRERVRQAAGSKFWEFFDYNDRPNINGDEISLFNIQLQNTISEENVQQAKPFLNGEGHLCVAVPVYSMAGADFYWQEIDLDDFTLMSDYDQGLESAAKGGITEEEAYELVRDYWNFVPGTIVEETGQELFLNSCGSMTGSNGRNYYEVRLQWLVDGDTEWGHLSTISVMYVDAETGELIDGILP